MDKEIPKQRVAIFKSMPDQPTSKDRYVGVLEANGMEAVAVPTLSFQFQVDHLLACLQNPEAYSGLFSWISNLSYEICDKSFYRVPSNQSTSS